MRVLLNRSRAAIAVLAILGCMIVFTGVAAATPSLQSPANGARISSSAQSFSWLDNLDYGPVDHWYLEISTDPLVDSWGFFWYLPVYSSPNLSLSSVNLNAIGRALPPGTYYWHVVGYYGPYGSLGTAWSLPVRSFTVYDSAASAPIVNVTPGSLSFTAAQGGANPAAKSLYVSNKGTGTLVFQAAKNATAWLNDPVLGTNTGEIQELVISVNVAGLLPGVYSTGQIGVRDSTKLWSTATIVPVTLQIFSPDAAAPTGSLAINGGAAYAPATTTLNLSATDGAGSGLDKMSFKDDGGAWSAWYDYSPTAPWHWTGAAGTRKVWTKFKDKVGHVSLDLFDTVIMDPDAPGGAISINAGSAETNLTNVVLGLTASDGAGSGSAQMRFSNDGVNWSAFEPINTIKAWTLTGGDGAKTVYVQYKDSVGNSSAAISDTITLKQPIATKLTLSARPKAVVAGQATLLKGKLVDAYGRGLVGKRVKIKAGRKVIKTLTTGLGGVYKLKVKPRKKTIYKAVFAGDAAYKAATSRAAAVAIK